MTTSVDTQSYPDGIQHKAYGNITTTSATAAALTETLGFAPMHILFVNATDRIIDEWFYGMAAATSIHTAANGTITLETTNGITVSGNTFTMTATTMVASKVFYWVAEG